ncbi:TPA: virulence factor [Legionella pneumophila]|uniref:Type 4 adapter protein LvgA n=4 Tax=Legionella pneumophila TaxID=446 RepID=LVGA_LEGPH|nr:Dot/Icm type IV secretion system effector LvgA [Legionella pneumophila]Q5ZY48.1 RecName: Full=Type 4 adapter protein LvgA [Legionella pneumophila subsp. pneumophila str. Philadelphia 1]7BWK_D Chain D, Hypothetical virulence protein [Legionella pneumophila subsp. pneumophila str. Philadelphia 1]7BWK_I Chain I, Hypothetical virulence protein [Legionella pneumophila subsp. pneumophila str. Philadelphia 1]WBV62715.1 Dot/Icm type IV secretion system effector LvgA [Legionella pneumophila 130b]AAU
MADGDIEIKAGFVDTDLDDRKLTMIDDLNNPLAIVERVYLIWWHWADFHLHVISPHIDTITPAIVIEPELIPGSNDHEFVYSIHDSGSKLSTSKSQDMFSAGMSMCKLFYTIEKMVYILVERLKSGGVSMEAEVQIAFAGHEIAQRKAFESIINLPYNVVVTNFDPGIWGEKYLQNVKRLADKGYGYPPESPRKIYMHPVSSGTTARK